jgi:general secretion pathway protein A
VVLFATSGGSVQAASSLPAASKPTTSNASLESLVELENTARLLAVLLDSGRNVINENLLIAEPSRDGGASLNAASSGEHLQSDRRAPGGGTLRPDLTAATFERQLAEAFLSRSGIDIRVLDSARIPASTKTLLQRLVETSKSVVAEAQTPNVQDSHQPPVHLIPAVFGSRVATEFARSTGVQLKQTSLSPRNPANRPDEFERAALQEFADPAFQREKVLSEVTTRSGVLRLMFPLYATRQCLVCHGEPKGAVDGMGYPKEGLKLGQNAGAISVVIPVQK